jgi:hypothetical protein
MLSDDQEVMGAFLRDRDFLIFSPNADNSLCVCTIQVYNTTWVYNHKRHGKPKFPRAVTSEFLLVDMLNNLDMLVEDKGLLRERVRNRFAGR